MKVIAWLLTVIFFIIFLGILLINHPFHMIATQLGYRYHMFFSHAMMWQIVNATRITGASYKIMGKKYLKNLPTDKPVILVSNHQSEFEIPLIGVMTLPKHTKFIAKKELAAWIPSISWTLRHGHHIIIDRNKREEAMKIIDQHSEQIMRYNHAVCIFAEGTRSRVSNELRPFKQGGFIQLYESLPEAIIVPIAVKNFWHFKQLPIKPFVRCSVTVLEAVPREGKDAVDILKICEDKIREALLA